MKRMKPDVPIAMQHLRSLVLLAVLALASFALPAATDPAPEKVQALLKMLADPEVQRWLAREHAQAAAAPAASPAAGEAMLAGQIDGIRGHIASVLAALPRVPLALADAWARLRSEMQAHGTGSVLVLVLAFAALGFGAEWLYWQVSGSVRRWIMAAPLDTAADRLRAAGVRFGFAVSWVAAFALGTVGAFLAFDWPPVLRATVLHLLVAVVLIRMARTTGRLVFAPGGPRFRLIPVDTPAAWFWHRRFLAAMVWVALQYAVLDWLVAMGSAEGVVRVVAYAMYVVQFALFMEMVWRRPGNHDTHQLALNWLLTVSLLVLLLLRVVGAFPLFWLGTIALVLVCAMRLVEAVAAQLQRPADAPFDAPVVSSVAAVAVVRAIRLVLIIGAGLLLALAWGINLAQLFTGETVTARVLRGVFSVVVIALFFDLLWFVFKAELERRLAQAQAVGAGDADSSRATRLRTVLPILRNVSFVTLALIAVLTALSALGVDIAPMVAGAGVLGIAVGFGAQTLVKDIVSGMFFLFDDAFRVGEYIQSGSYKGTVESFSLRSVRLRHHRGPVYTVPFGELGAVQNMSRDWVIDKLAVGITYDSNLELARKLIKKIGQDLAADPEMGPQIIEPLKMQGVEQFGDFAIHIRMKMMTRPGEQFVIRRKAYAAIKAAFDANGITFAFPKVQVAGGANQAVAAAAQQLLSANAKPAGA